MKLKTILFILLFLNFNFFGQTNKKIDSLKQIVRNSKVNDTTKISTNLKLSKEYLSIDLDSFDSYTSRAYYLSLKNNNYKLSHIYSNLGLHCVYKSKLDSAKYYLDKAVKILDKNEDKNTRAKVYSNYVMLYHSKNNFDKKIAYNLKAINLMKNNDSFLSKLYYNHSILYGGHIGFEDQAKKYLKLAYLSSLRSNNFRLEGITLSNLANYCIAEKKLDSAKFYLEKGLLLCEKTKDTQLCYEVNVELGKLYVELNKFDRANQIFLNANKYAVFRKKKYDIMVSNIYLGRNEFNRGNYNKSTDYFKKVDSLLAQETSIDIRIELYKSWSETEKKKGDYKKSNELLEKSMVLKDSIFSQKNREITANADAKYQTEKKDKEIAEKNVQLQKQKIRNNYITTFAIFLLIVSIFTRLFFKQRQKRKNQEIVTLKREHQIKTLETLIEGEEKERLRMAKELHDGVNGDLSAIKLKLSTLLEMNNSVITEAIEMIDNSCSQVRAISHNLVPPSLENFNLIEAVEEYCVKTNDLHTENITFQHLGDEVVTLSKKEEINSYRIIQELVSNSLKHAKATEINVQISCRNNIMTITVEDNGVGFEKEQVKNKGIGLSNIQSRMDYLHATVDFVSNKKGTSYTIEIDKN